MQHWRPAHKGYVTKPFDTDELVSTLRAALKTLKK